MIEKTASVHRKGLGKKGQGRVSAEPGALDRHPYGVASRFEDDRRGTNPEEISPQRMQPASRWPSRSPATRAVLPPAKPTRGPSSASKALAAVAEIRVQATLDKAGA